MNEHYKCYFKRADVAEFAEIMDAMMLTKEMERELDGSSFYIKNPGKVIQEIKNQYDSLIAAAGTLNILVEKDFEENPNECIKNFSIVQKRAVHVANYCMMLFGIAQNKAFELDKLRKQKNRLEELKPKHPCS